MKLKYLFLAPIVFLFACQPDPICRLNTKVQMGVAMRYIEPREVNGQEKYVEITSWDSVSVQGVGSDSILYDNEKDVSLLNLFLRNDTTFTQYLFTWHAMTDTLSITHTNIYDFISMACGCVVDHEITDIRHSRAFIDSVEISSATVSLIDMQHIKLHLRLR